MCGFLGLISPNQSQVPSAAFSIMLGTLYHRGPDSQKIWQDEYVQLGFSRLAIIDLSSSGEQPMLSQNGDWTILMNGEIYNYQSLRTELSAENSIQWRGHSDTEVVLECIQHWGIEKTLKKIEGMFALAAYSKKIKKFFLARDRLGEKPLYYGKIGDHFAFASELKALTKHPQWNKELNKEAVKKFIRFGFIPTPLSIYENIFKLKPGTYLEVSTDSLGIEQKIYWSISNNIKNIYHTSQLSYSEALLETENRLSQIIKQEMISDVPLGAFLSGGVDSSTIVALMQKNSSRKIKTFTIGFEQKDYNEATYAQAVAQHLNTDHTELYVTDKDAMKVVTLLPQIFDEPFADSSQIPTFLVSSLAKKQVTVCLTGDGGDEVFAGYNRYIHAPALWQKVQLMPSFMRKGTKFISSQIPPSIYDVFSGMLKVSRAGEKIQKIQKILDANSPDEFFLKLISFWEFGNETLSFENWLSNFTEQLMLHDLENYLPDDILVKTDRSMMFHSLEGRTPFIHHQMVEWSWSLPLEYKLRNGRSKAILRDILTNYVPQNLIERPKMGFGIPLDQWLRGPLKAWADNYLNQAIQSKFFDSLEIKKAWKNHLNGKVNSQHELWNIIILMQWLEAQQITADSL